MGLVVTYGTFDMLHVGHLRLLERARALGTGLAVGVSTDAFNATKGKEAVVPFAERCELLLGLGCVDEVFAEESWEQKETDIVRMQVRTFAMGSDWVGKFDHLATLCEVVYLPRTDLISSTILRRRAATVTEGLG